MFECRKCGRKFKTMQELGGHVANAHKEQLTDQTMANEEQTQFLPQPSDQAEPGEVPPPPEASEAEQIRFYWQKGYTYEQLTTKLGFKPTTVRQEIAKMVKPEGKISETEEEIPTLPLVLKDGKGEVLSPEAVYHRLVLSDGIDGERDFRALMKWAASIEMVQRMTQINKTQSEALAEMVKPVLDMMEKSRQELDAAAARAKESSMEIAEAAAAGAAARATMRIDERFDQIARQKKDIAETEKPMEGLMARTMESMIQRMTGMMFGGQGGGQVGPTPGMVDKRGQGGKLRWTPSLGQDRGNVKVGSRYLQWV